MLNLFSIRQNAVVDAIMAKIGFISQFKSLNFTFVTHKSLVMLNVAFINSVKYTVMM